MFFQDVAKNVQIRNKIPKCLRIFAVKDWFCMRKIYTIAIYVILVVALCLWVKSRWRAWFKNVVETELSVAMSPDRITMLPSEDFMTERCVTWRCGVDTIDSYLTLVCGTDTTLWKAKGEHVVGSGDVRDAFYRVELFNLQAGKAYRYQVTTGERSSRWYDFVMPIGDAHMRKFLFFGDVQDTIGGKSGEMLCKLYNEHADTEFWACAGDLIERPINKYWNYLYESTGDSLLATMPLINAVGNHDYWKGIIPELDIRWCKTFSYPMNGAKTAKGNSYYIDFPDMRFIVFDTHGINSIMGIMGTYKWLRETLRTSGEKWKVVMMHHPVFSVRKGRDNFAIRNAFKPLFDKYGVHLVLQGHEHGYLRYVSHESGYPVYVVSYASPKSYKAREAVEGMKIVGGMPMYHTVEYTDEEMKIRAYSVEKDSLVDEISIKR